MNYVLNSASSQQNVSLVTPAHVSHFGDKIDWLCSDVLSPAILSFRDLETFKDMVPSKEKGTVEVIKKYIKKI